MRCNGCIPWWKRHQSLRLFLARFLSGVIVLYILTSLFPFFYRQRQIALIEDQYRTLVEDSIYPFQRAGARCSSVLRLAALGTTRALGQNATQENADAVVETFEAWSTFWPSIYELRFIAPDGSEEAEVYPLWEDDTTLLGYDVANKTELINVGSEAFFAPSIALSSSELYVSGIERQAPGEKKGGKDAIPVIHSAASVANGNATSGFVLITLQASNLLESIVSTLDTKGVPYLSAGVGHTSLLIVNAEGDYLGGDVPEGAFFAWEEGEETAGDGDDGLATDNPDLWAAVTSKTNDSFLLQSYHSKDLVTVQRANLCELVTEDTTVLAACISGSAADIYVVLSVPQNYILGRGIQPWEVASLVSLLVGAVLWALLCLLWVKNINSERNIVKRTLEMAQFRSRNKELFLQTMCHEIRMPLNAVVGAISMLAGPDIPPSKAPLVSIMEDASSLMMSVLNDILDVGKIESGQLHLSPVAFNVRDVLGACVEVHAAAALRKRLDVFLSFGADTPEILIADDLRIRQMLSNLLSNAIKFTDAGEITVSVDIDCGGESCRGSRGRGRTVASGAAAHWQACGSTSRAAVRPF